MDRHGSSLLHSKVVQSCPTLCNPTACRLPGSSVHGILQARVLEWVATSFSRGSSRPRDQTRVSSIADRRFTVWASREAGRDYQTPWWVHHLLRLWSLSTLSRCSMAPCWLAISELAYATNGQKDALFLFILYIFYFFRCTVFRLPSVVFFLLSIFPFFYTFCFCVWPLIV